MYIYIYHLLRINRLMNQQANWFSLRPCSSPSSLEGNSARRSRSPPVEEGCCWDKPSHVQPAPGSCPRFLKPPMLVVCCNSQWIGLRENLNRKP